MTTLRYETAKDAAARLRMNYAMMKVIAQRAAKRGVLGLEKRRNIDNHLGWQALPETWDFLVSAHRAPLLRPTLRLQLAPPTTPEPPPRPTQRPPKPVAWGKRFVLIGACPRCPDGKGTLAPDDDDPREVKCIQCVRSFPLASIQRKRA